MRSIVSEYQNGMSVSDIACNHKMTERKVRIHLKSRILWHNRTVDDLSVDDKIRILEMYKNQISVLEISDIFQIPSPMISNLLLDFGIKRIYHKGKRFENLKSIPLSKKHKEFIIGTLLGDGCIRKNGNLPRLCLVHSKKFENYFQWKLSQMDYYFNSWRQKPHPRKNSILLYSETLQNPNLEEFYSMFYPEQEKIVPDNLDQYMTPYSLAVWFMDDGTLNCGVSQRIHTNGFIYRDQIKLQALLKRCFDIDVKILLRKDGHYYLSLNVKNSIKLSNIIDRHVIPRMRYKLRLR